MVDALPSLGSKAPVMISATWQNVIQWLFLILLTLARVWSAAKIGVQADRFVGPMFRFSARVDRRGLVAARMNCTGL